MQAVTILIQAQCTTLHMRNKESYKPIDIATRMHHKRLQTLVSAPSLPEKLPSVCVRVRVCVNVRASVVCLCALRPRVCAPTMPAPCVCVCVYGWVCASGVCLRT